MARFRTNKKLLKPFSPPQSLGQWLWLPLTWLGRFSYKLPIAFGKILVFFLNILLPSAFKKSTSWTGQFIRKRYLILIPLLLFFASAFYFYLAILKDLPGPNRLITRNQVVSTKIYDRHGELLFTIYDGNQNRSLVQLNEIPNFAKQATIAIEDKDFYQHTGFSIQGIIRAIIRNLSTARVEGGSTITQQLIKNALLSPEKTIKRKIKEIILSMEAEIIFSKDEILQMYFNEVPYGGTAYGIAEASETYFGKNVKDLNLAEAALLAGLPAAPTKYSPFGANPKLTLSRQHQVLDQMVEEGYLTLNEAMVAKKEKIILAPARTDIKAPHFVMYVKDLLVQKYGQRQVEQGGLEVTTSLDLGIQQMAQEKLNAEIDKLQNLKVTNGAVLVTEPKTGGILAMVGSKDYFNLNQDGNVNLTTALRQPGSSIKVITYALALSNGYTPATVISDSPITYYSPGSPSYSPLNYDNRFHGNVTLRTALACSYNVPAVKTLASLGVDKMIDLGQKMGITTWVDRSRFGLSLTLGAGEVKMTDMAAVYGTLANLGLNTDLKPLLQVKDYQGRVLYEAAKDTSLQRVLDPKVAFLLSDILKDNQARTPAFGPTSFLAIPNNEVAVKTGTTNDKRDNWTIGYTQDYLVAVWVGNNDNSPMAAVASGITGASPIWNRIMLEMLKDKPASHFSPPDNLVKLSICTWNGLLSCEGCPSQDEYFLPGSEPKIHCSSEEMKKIQEELEKKKRDKILEGISTQN